MPANLTPDYLRAEERYKKASTPHDRLEALKEMYAALPKHKGTEKMQADLKKRIAALREDLQKSDKKKVFGVKVDPEGAGQIAFAGLPNAGKSKLISALTGTHLESAAYPFTTRLPHPAMMAYEDIQIQLVDLPPVSSQHMEFWLPTILRNADLLAVVVDLSSSSFLADIDELIALLQDNKLQLVNVRPKENFWASVAEKKAWFIATKSDLPASQDNWRRLEERWGGRYGLSVVSAETGANLERARKDLVQALELIRIYSKPPGKPADMTKPFCLQRGATLLDFANLVHRDFSEHLKFARVWGHGKFDGQRINRDDLLQDKDIIELHL
jgi:ribosome-interacting GTPase 1